MKSPHPLLLSWLFLILVAASPAAATPWAYPDEISVADVFDTLNGTAYETGNREDLDLLRADHGGTMQESWTTSEIGSIVIVAFDTRATHSLGLLVEGSFLELFDPGSWTPPTRGLVNDPASASFLDGAIDLAQVLTDAGFLGTESFSFVLGGASGKVLNAGNSILIEGLAEGEFLIGYNDGGHGRGDVDFNEPLFLANPGGSGPHPTPEPSVAILLLLAAAAWARRRA